MPQNVAALGCVLFILWLFKRDANRRKVSFALWIPLTWAFIIASKPISVWLGLGSATSGGEGYVEGSPFDRMFFLVLIVAGWGVLARRNINWSTFFRCNRWLWIYFAYLGISALWSDFPFVSFKRWLKDAGNIIMALVVLTEEQPLEAIKGLLVRCVYLLIPMSVLLVKYYPELGRYYDNWTYKPYFCGVSTDKNLLGMSLYVCALSLMWLLFDWRSSKPGSREKLEWYTLLFLAITTFWLLIKARSSTALGCTILGCLILAGTRFPAIRRKARLLGAYSLGMTIVLLLLHVTLNLGGVLAQVMGRDLTFTGRTDIWTMLLQEPVNPLFGEGFYSFWMGDRVERLSAKYFYQLNEAHNGYLETYLNSGLIGLTLLVILLVSACNRIQQRVVAGSVLGAVQLAFLLGIIVYNFTEAAFDRLDLPWFVLLLLIVEYGVTPRTLATKA